MVKNIRKVVRLNLVRKSLNKGHFSGYYKLEKNSNTCRITLNIEDIYLDRGEGFLYVVDGQLTCKLIGTVKVGMDGKIYQIFPVDPKWIETIKGVVITAYQQKEINFTRDVILVGFHDEPFEIGDLSTKKSIAQGEVKETKTTSESQKPKSIVQEKSQQKVQENHQQKSPEKPKEKTDLFSKIHKSEKQLDELIGDKLDIEKKEDKENKEVVDKKEIDKQIINENETKMQVKQEEPQEVKSTVNEKNNYENTNCEDADTFSDPTFLKRDSQENTDSSADNNVVNELNTLELIKKQLEENHEINKFDELFDRKEKWTPFEKVVPDEEWVRIDISDLMFLPLEAWMLMNNAFIINSYRKYKHLILGRNKREKVLKLGIPDIYYMKDSIVANICGFHQFISCKETFPKSGEYGYWIIKAKI